jgi:hypothetical protein
VHGDVMMPGIRRQLRQALGLCSRHTWGYAVVEIELWLTGGGIRGGHQPFDVCVLYEDVLEVAIDRLESRRLPWRHDFALVVDQRASCRICDALTGPGSGESGLGYAASDTLGLTVEANRLRYTVAWCRETVDVWRDRVCPACAAVHHRLHGRSSDLGSPPSTALLCRQHLMTRPAPPAQASAAVAPCLRLLRRDLLALLRSMEGRAKPPSAQQNASWVETISWFAGWQLPLSVVDL